MDTASLLQRSFSAPGRCNCCFQASLQRSCNAPGSCNCCFLAFTTFQQCSLTLPLLLPGLDDGPATTPDAAAAVSWPLQSSSNAPGRCHCCFLASASLLRRSCDAAPQCARTLQLLRLDRQHAPATIQDAATAASGAIARSCNVPGRCDCPATVASGAMACSCNSQALLPLLLWYHRKPQEH